MTDSDIAYQTDQFSISLKVRGNREYTKVSYPVKYGIFSRLETRGQILEFNLNHEITHARSKSADWLHPSEWLKRTRGNDWIYYSSGGYAGCLKPSASIICPISCIPPIPFWGADRLNFR